MTIQQVNNLIDSKVGPVTAAFSASIPFTRDYTYMNHTVAGAIAFTPNPTGRIVGGGTYIRLVADGTNAPTFSSAFNITGGTYDNTLNMVNRLIFLWNGYEYELSIAQLGVVVVPDTNAPTVVSRTATNLHTIQVVFNETAYGTTAGWSAKINGGAAITPTAVSGATTRSLTFSQTFLDTDTITLSYDASTGDTVDASANEIASFTNAAVTNSVPPVDSIAPTLVSAVVSNAIPTRIVLTWSEPMNTTLSPTSAFAVSAGHTLTGTHTMIDSTHSYLTTSVAFVNGEAARTLSYTQPGSDKMQDISGNLLANITAASITNNVAAGLSSGALTYTNRNGNLTNSGTTFSGVGSNGYGYDSLSLPSSGDGMIYHTGDTAYGVIQAFDNVAAVQDYPNYQYGYFASTNSIYSITNGTISGSAVGTISTGDLVGVRRTAGVFTIEKSTDNGATWTVLHTFSGTDNGQKYANGWVAQNQQMAAPRYIGLT